MKKKPSKAKRRATPRASKGERYAELIVLANRDLMERIEELFDERFDHVVAEVDMRINEIRGIEINRATMPSKDDLLAAAELLALQVGLPTEKIPSIRPRLDRVATWLRGLEVKPQEQGGAVCS